jgi:hypothetical protein
VPRSHSFSSSALLVPRSTVGVPDSSLMVLPAPALPPAAAVAAAAGAPGSNDVGCAVSAAAAAADRDAAGTAAEQPPAAREAVWASHLCSFSFKGSGTFDMVHIVSDGLSGRSFQYQAPRGKGARLEVAAGRVQGLPDVQLVVPGEIVAAWQAAAERHAAAAAVRVAAGGGEELGVLQREPSLQSNAPLQREQSLQSAAGQRPLA